MTLNKQAVDIFPTIISFEYYDGPERGLALLPSGRGARFTALGESRTRLQRAFVFTTIAGQWETQTSFLQVDEANRKGIRILVPEDDVRLDALEMQVFNAEALAHYVGLGSPKMEGFKLHELSREQHVSLMRSTSPASAFRLASQLIKLM